MKSINSLIARIFISSIFLVSAVGHIVNFDEGVDYMREHGMQFIPNVFLIIGIVLLIGGGFSLLLGYRARFGALLLIVFLIPATLIFHTNFSGDWTALPTETFANLPVEVQDTMSKKARGLELVMLLKNIAILGGLMLIASNGAGRIGLSGR